LRMRSWLAVSLISLLVSPCLFAQRGGAHGGGGGHAGGFSGSRGFSSGPSFSGGMGSGRGMSFVAPRQNFSPNFGSQSRMAYPARSFSTYPGASSPRASYPTTGNPAGRSAYGQMNHGVKRGPYPGSGHSQARYPYRRPYFYAHSTYLVPGLLNYWPYFGDWGSSDDSGYADQGGYAVQPDTGQDEAYAPQAEQPGYEPIYPPAPYSEPSPEPAVTLVFKDGHSLQIHNYAATRSTLLLLDGASSGRTSQVPLDEIDVAATERVNREAGVDFSLPTAN
jgi:hypothetical protein